MSLKGHLEVFPLEEVLRLLARSKKSGSLRVDSSAHAGRIFMAGGSISYATVNDDDYLRRQVVNAGLVSESALSRGGRAALPELLAEGIKNSALSDFIREEVVESLYRIRKAGSGAFEFHVDLTPMYPTGQSFDTDVAVSEADRRAVEWLEIEKVLDDLSAPLRMTRALPDENDATVTPAGWKLLARLESGHSIDDLSAMLGISRYRAAREIADQMRAGRVEKVPFEVPAVAYEPEPTYEAPAWGAPADEPVAEEPVAEEPVAQEPVAEEPVAEEPAASAPVESVWGQWSDEPAAEVPVFEEAAAEAPIFTDPEATEEVPAAEYVETTDEAQEPEESPAQTDDGGGWWAQTMGETTNADADAFLESVFGELEESDAETTEPDQGFGVGLLRRRRMGAVARDLTDGDN